MSKVSAERKTSRSKLLRLRGLIAMLYILGASAYLGHASTAYAQTQPLDPDVGTGRPIQAPPVTQVVHYGTPAWVFVLVGVGAVCLTIAAMLLTTRLRHGRPAVNHA